MTSSSDGVPEPVKTIASAETADPSGDGRAHMRAMALADELASAPRPSANQLRAAMEAHALQGRIGCLRIEGVHLIAAALEEHCSDGKRQHVGLLVERGDGSWGLLTERRARSEEEEPQRSYA